MCYCDISFCYSNDSQRSMCCSYVSICNFHDSQGYLCCCDISFCKSTTPNALCVLTFPSVIPMIPNALCVVVIFPSAIPMTPSATCVVVIFAYAYEEFVALFLSLALSFPPLSPALSSPSFLSRPLSLNRKATQRWTSGVIIFKTQWFVFIHLNTTNWTIQHTCTPAICTA